MVQPSTTPATAPAKKEHKLTSLYGKIELLTADNYPIWKDRTLAILEDAELEEVLDVSKKPQDSQTDELAEWNKMDKKVKGQIRLTVSGDQFQHILGVQTAAEMWSNLKMVNEGVGAMGLWAAMRRFYRMTAEEGTDMVAHIATFNSLRVELTQLGHTITNREFICAIIMSLPDSYDQFTSGFLGADNIKNDPQSTKEFTSLLIAEWRRRSERQGQSALYAKQGRSSRKGKAQGTGQGGSSSRSDIECYNCRKKGHKKEDCWAKGGGKEGQGPKRKGKERANHAEEVNRDLD
jgi:gag-polypeptide of LTR copia-type